jgi:hypothetical protein
VGAGSLMGVGTDDSSPHTFFAGSVRVDVRPRLAVEAEFAHWGDEQTSRVGPGVITIVGSDNTVTYGFKESTTTHTSHTTWEGTVSFLAHSTGRVSVFGSGGFGVGAARSEYDVSYTGCTAPSRPQVCDPYSLPRDNSGFTLLASGGVDAMITDRVGGFASVRANTGYLYRPSSLAAMAGARVRIR